MLQVSKLLPQGAGLAPALLKRAATVELDWDMRQKSRFDATDSLGRQLGIFLPRGTVVRGGDVLVAEDGSLMRVMAAPQSVLAITPCTDHGTPFDLIRAAYHLGNRHVPIELKPDHLKIEPDHVLADMLRAMHLIVNEVERALRARRRCLRRGRPRRHAHGHGHGHGHAPCARRMHATRTATAARPSRSRPAPQPHVHGPGCSRTTTERDGPAHAGRQPAATDVAGLAGAAGWRLFLFGRPGSRRGIRAVPPQKVTHPTGWSTSCT